MSNSRHGRARVATGDGHTRLSCTIEYIPCGHRMRHNIYPRFGLEIQVQELGLPLHLKIDHDRFCPDCQKIHLSVLKRCPGEILLLYIWTVLSRVRKRSITVRTGPKLLRIALEELSAHWWLELRNCETVFCHGDEWEATLDAWAKRSVDVLTDEDIRDVYLRLKGNRLIDLGEDDMKHLPEKQAEEVIEVLTKEFISKNPRRNLPWVHDLLG